MPTHPILLRLAKIEDTNDLFDWRNVPVARGNSVNPEPPQLDSHIA